MEASNLFGQDAGGGVAGDEPVEPLPEGVGPEPPADDVQAPAAIITTKTTAAAGPPSRPRSLTSRIRGAADG